MEVLARYKVTRPTETHTVDEHDRVVYHFTVAVIDDETGKVVREFHASDLDNVRGAFRAIDEMLVWLKRAP